MSGEKKLAGGEPSPDLLDVIHSCQLRQSWYREYARSEGMDPLIFTLIHEFIHLWLGSSGLSDVSLEPDAQSTEVWCNKAAAEFLVPFAELKKTEV